MCQVVDVSWGNQGIACIIVGVCDCKSPDKEYG
jgi:hypothetical protein